MFSKLLKKIRATAPAQVDDNFIKSDSIKVEKPIMELVSETADIPAINLAKAPKTSKEATRGLSRTGICPNNEKLFQKLKTLRMDLAKKINKPAYIVFSDKTLLDMIAKMPSSASEMLEVHGIGDTKLELYGEEFLKILLDEQNNRMTNIASPDVLEGVAHHDFLISNIEKCQSSLIVMSGWITTYVVDDTFLELIEKKLQQGIKLYIGYGCQDSNGKHKEMRGSKQVLLVLKKLIKKYPEQLFIANFATHEKLLLIDTKTVVIGSANWLSNKHYTNSERSLIIQNSEFAKKEFDRATNLIMQNLIK